MLNVRYENKEIILTPSTMDENQTLMDCVRHIPDVAYRNSAWIIKEQHLHKLKDILAPFNGKFDKDKSFTDFIKKIKVKNAAKLTIYVDVNYSKIVGANIPSKEIDDACKYFWKPAVRNDKYKKGYWDGYIHLYKNRSFPTGLLYVVEDILKKSSIDYQIIHNYERSPDKQFNWKPMDGFIIDKDQEEAIDAGYEGKRGILKAPTGFGKTAILAKRLTAKFGVPTLFIANKKSLLDDAAQAFLDLDGVDDVAEIKDGKFGFTKVCKAETSDDIAEISSPIVVATIQSLSARLKDIKTRDKLKYWLNNVCKFVMVDECQAVGTKTWEEVLDECKAPYRICLSATPNRTDGGKIKINAQSGPTLFFTTAEEQIEKGRLCELNIEYIVFNHALYNEKDTDVQYQDAYKSWIVENDQRNELIISKTLEMVKEERLVLVLVSYIEHGSHLKDLFMASGINPDDIRFIYGDTRDQARKNAIKEFRKGKFKILIGSTIFDAGVNIPAISGIVLAGAGNSDITHIQRIGRGARVVDFKEELGYLPDFLLKNDGEKVTKVVDFFDDNVKFFKSQSWNRYKIAKEEFGKQRVKLIGQLEARKNITRQKENIDFIEANESKLNLIKEFLNTDQKPTRKTNDNIGDFINAFNDLK